jgi:hypothetical protein
MNVGSVGSAKEEEMSSSSSVSNSEGSADGIGRELRKDQGRVEERTIPCIYIE